MAFARIQKQRVADQVAEAIQEAILTGEYAPGDPLPSERDLAARFGVNRSSVREALHRLEAWRLIEIRQGGATLVQDVLATAGLQLLPQLIAPGGAPDPVFVQNLAEIREVLMAWTAGRAVQGATPEALEALRETLAALEAPDATAEQLRTHDLEFFRQLVLMTGNRVLLLFANVIRQVYLEHPELFLPIHQPGQFHTTHHREVLDALSRGDGPVAAAAMEAFARSARDLLGELGAPTAAAASEPEGT